MAHYNKLNFIVIDDSKLDCFIAERVIRNTGKSNSIISFLKAEEALEHIRCCPTDSDTHTIVFVDIQMPIMNGFQFVEAFDLLPAETREAYSIYVISSSINDVDLRKVHRYSSVKQFLNKPLSSNNLAILFLQAP